MSKPESFDVVLVGGGVMSATLGTMIKLLAPKLTIRVFERLDDVALESSNPWNNAGTGHAALCELNYMPDSKDGGLPDPAKAIAINEQFQVSRQFWSYLVTNKILGAPSSFIHAVPHMTFVRGSKDVDYLRRRHLALKDQPLFAGMEYSDKPDQIAKWAPLIMAGRHIDEPIAATRIEAGTDVDFGSITRQLFDYLEKQGVTVATSHEVRGLKRQTSGGWAVRVHNNKTGHSQTVNAKFVFVGAGGWALKLLQKSGIAEASGYGTFPISGSFFRTDNQDVVKQHQAKVYSQAAVGAPPMSVPHLDTRVVDGAKSLLFGPYAGANPKFLKNGSVLDLPGTLRPANIIPYLSVAVNNLGLLKYLIGELLTTKKAKFAALQEFMPEAKPEDWYLITAGQRAQVIKKANGGGILQFGTEVITSADGSISGLLGASPGASTAVPIMLDVLQKSFSKEFAGWQSKLKAIIPSLGVELNKDAAKAKATFAATDNVLGLAKAKLKK